MQHEETVDFAVLGPIEARRGSVTLDLGPPKRRALLARLLVAEGRPTPADQLCEDLWEGRPPAGALSSLHAHISRLRAVLEPGRSNRGPATILVGGTVGYALDAPPGARDSTRFRDLTHDARRLLTSGRLRQALQEVDQALGMWRGTALADAAHYAFAAQEISRLEDARTTAEELRAAILLEQGDLPMAIAAAEQVTARTPMREAAWVLLIRALYLAGRPAEALQRYEAIRVLLADELGTDPGPTLRDIYVAVLRHDTVALMSSPQIQTTVTLAPLAPVSTARPVPGLPVVGRAEELAKLDELLKEAAAGHTVWAVVSGEAGIGRTRLAEEFTARAAAAGFAIVRAHCGHDLATHRSGGEFGPAEQLLYALGHQVPADSPADNTSSGTLEDVAQRLAEQFSRQPTVCVIEDLHCAPRDFRQLLALFTSLLRDIPLAVVCTMQDVDDHALGELVALLIRRGGAALLPLAPLDVADVRELLGHYDDRPPESSGSGWKNRHAAELHRRSQGNPFFLSEMLKLPADRRTGAHAQVPPTLGRVLGARLNRLGGSVRAMLEVTAVAGGFLDAELVTKIGTTSPADLLSFIDAAVNAGVLVWEEGDVRRRTGGYRLAELPREVILSGLTIIRKQALHAALADALAELPWRHPVQLARHLLAAGPLVPREDLAAAAFCAGQRCAADNHHTEAALWFEHAASATGDAELRARALALGAAQPSRGQLDQLPGYLHGAGPVPEESHIG